MVSAPKEPVFEGVEEELYAEGRFQLTGDQ